MGERCIRPATLGQGFRDAGTTAAGAASAPFSHVTRAPPLPRRRRAGRARLPRPRRGHRHSRSRLIAEAAANDAQLIAFPETWLPGYPWFIWLDAPAWGLQFFPRYHDNSLEYGTPEAEKLAAAAREHGITVALGLSERRGGSLYIAQWIIGPDGETIAQRRKLKPTHVERTVFGEGDGSDLSVYPTPSGAWAASAAGSTCSRCRNTPCTPRTSRCTSRPGRASRSTGAAPTRSARRSTPPPAGSTRWRAAASWSPRAPPSRRR